MITTSADIKLYVTNLLAIGVSFTNAEDSLKILLLLISIAYTAERWIAAIGERRKKNKNHKK